MPRTPRTVPRTPRCLALCKDPAIVITDVEDLKIIEQVLNGNFLVVFGLPKCLLSTAPWRGIFKSESFSEMLIEVAIDEAHCITQW